ncbi:hypothetical protein CLG94_12475 [Candidatus Methylomirabilis limnetica]|uniref:BioF2-like acetyltransferase domain-containing protein n=1 Tax=Candidatus Methylomirabilis limnetica TaxID=2033718 RepID=A0A2T4TUW7_9BACT|nr:GNAT family N-acetyltransferase [Candidatus Methylomirabilis limnetica]PTL34907.1 hypothetical protein CLG94_12475 [Candidatus Methylomirabilis limnetica]
MRELGWVSDTLWEDVARNCEYATFFHTPAWGRLFETAGLAVRRCARGFLLDDQRVAIVPAVETSIHLGGLMHGYAMTAANVYGGVISTRRLAQWEIESILSRLTGPRTIELTIVENPYAPFELPRPFLASNDFTHVLDLSAGIDQVLRGTSHGNRYSVKKAVKMGVKVRIAESLEDFKAYYAVYHDSLRRWGGSVTSRYPWQLFEAIREYAQSSEACRLWIAEVRGLVVAGALVFYWNGWHAVWWHGAGLESYFSYSPTNLLQSEIIRDAHGCGYRWYDFNPSGGHAGVVAFKESFGAARMRVKVSRWENPMYHVYRRLRRLIR